MSRGRPPLAPGDYVFMALLGWAPMSAYDVKKAMATSVNFFWSAAHSQVYQQAKRLVRDGYVEETDAGSPRRRRLLSLTPAGREALAGWLRSPAPLFRSYDEAIAKLFFGDQSEPAALAAMLEDQQRRHGELLSTYEAMASVLSGWDPGSVPPYPLLTLRLGLRIERAWTEWLAETIALLRAWPGPPPAPPAPPGVPPPAPGP
jgi:PadR family transcriptional regulator AphA